VEHLQELLAKPVLKSMMIPATKYEARRSGHKPVFVIHETCSPGTATLKQVTKPDYKASFHALILRDGTIVEMVPANKTAWTAGHSEFEDQSNHSGYKNVTVNHFAYQVELESPADGYWCAPGSTKCIDGGGRGTTHSGYTDEQYVALAWLAVKTGIAPERITTHAYVDRSGTRTDPRSFNWNKFWYYYDLVPDREKTISLGIE
jgi:N-acetyl-anhydromuramyl-L-alanine amidase AmpD